MSLTTAITFPRQLRGPHGFRAQRVYTGTDISQLPEQLTALYATGDGAQYQLLFDASSVSQAQVDKALTFLCHDPQWRNQVLMPAAPPTWEASSGREALYQYDEVMAPLLDELARSGVNVARYNKGTGHVHGSTLTLTVTGPWPLEVAQVLESLGWLMSGNGLKASLPKGYGHVLHGRVVLLLDDWLNASLDHSAERYRVIADVCDWMPPMKTYPETALLEQLEKNKRKARKLNTRLIPASFDAYAKLTCGRDSLSGQSLDHLIDQLKGDEVLPLLDEVAENPAILAKALRWRLRGLSVLHTLNKYQVDCVLDNHAEEKRYKKRLVQFGDKAYPLLGASQTSD